MSRRRLLLLLLLAVLLVSRTHCATDMEYSALVVYEDYLLSNTVRYQQNIPPCDKEKIFCIGQILGLVSLVRVGWF